MTLSIRRSLLTCALALTALAGCASPISVGADHDSQADFSTWHTWAFVTPSQPSENEIVDRRVDDAVRKVLTERGFAQASPEEADFLVGHDIHLKQETSVHTSSMDPYWQSGGGGRYRSSSWTGVTDVRRYEVGTLYVEFLDRRAGFVAWRGHASATLDASLEPSERDARVEEGVRKMIAQFPPSPK